MKRIADSTCATTQDAYFRGFFGIAGRQPVLAVAPHAEFGLALNAAWIGAEL
ncbi:MAG: hypothetical protein AAFR28_04765 [Pseudomonadota bacterium]